jgi:hypothetical protein
MSKGCHGLAPKETHHFSDVPHGVHHAGRHGRGCSHHPGHGRAPGLRAHPAEREVQGDGASDGEDARASRPIPRPRPNVDCQLVNGQAGSANDKGTEAPITCRSRLGDLLNYYDRVAA